MQDASPAAPMPLKGIRVVEFSHMVMGPTCGMVLGDLGADVIKVEPVGGDATRGLLGTGAGFFRAFNRNKRSLAVDVTRPQGRELILRLAEMGLKGVDVAAGRATGAGQNGERSPGGSGHPPRSHGLQRHPCPGRSHQHTPSLV